MSKAVAATLVSSRRVQPPNRHRAEPGYVASTPNTLTGDYNILYDGARAGLDTSAGRWQLVCTGHGGATATRTRAESLGKLARSLDWCAECRALHELSEARHVLRMRRVRTTDDQVRRWANIAKGNPTKCALFESMYGVKPDAFWDECAGES